MACEHCGYALSRCPECGFRDRTAPEGNTIGGFTQGDVEALRFAYEAVSDAAPDLTDRGWNDVARLVGIANRIEALLPPESA